MCFLILITLLIIFQVNPSFPKALETDVKIVPAFLDLKFRIRLALAWTTRNFSLLQAKLLNVSDLFFFCSIVAHTFVVP